MGDEYSVFGQLSQLNPSGKPRDAKEVPVDRDSRRKSKGKKKKPAVASQDNLEETAENESDQKPSGKVVDIII